MKIDYLISPSSILQKKTNCYFKDAITISSLEEFKKICSHDYMCGSFKNNYRKDENFILTNSIPMDMDNKHSDNPKEWITVDDIKSLFEGVPFLVHYSRNHMKPKEGRSPRPKFHIIFKSNEITDGTKLEELKKKILEICPYFDVEALGASRFFFGTTNPIVEYVDGNITIDEFIANEDEKLDRFTHLGESIEEGKRNKTMHKIALSLLTKYGNTDDAHNKYIEASNKCNPLLDDTELMSIWNSALRFYTGTIAKSSSYIKPEVYNKTKIVWDELIPLKSKDLPAFPIDALPKVLKDYSIAVSESLQTPIDMAAVCALSVVSTAMHRKYRVSIKPDWEETINLYSLVIANPSERKSPVLKAMANVLHRYEATYNETNALKLEINHERHKQLKANIGDAQKKLSNQKITQEEYEKALSEFVSFKLMHPLMILADDITPEALAIKLNEQEGTLAILSSEGGFFDIISGTYADNVNIDIVLKAYSGDSFKVDRVSRQGTNYIKCVILSLLLTIQPKVIEKMMDNDIFVGRGLNARFLYSFPTSKVGSRKFNTPAISYELKKDYEDLIFSILDEDQSKLEYISLTAEATEILKPFYEEIESRLDKDLKALNDWAGKLVGTTCRIAAILARSRDTRYSTLLATNEASITPEKDGEVFILSSDMSNAILIARYFIEHAKHAFNAMGIDGERKLAIDIVNYLKTLGETKSEITSRELSRAFRQYKIDKLIPALELLINYGYLEQKDNENKRGRPSNIYLINPQIFKEN